MNINALLDALDEIKSITKRIPASDRTNEFRDIANIAHRTLRDDANVDALRCACCGHSVIGDISVVCSRCIEQRGYERFQEPDAPGSVRDMSQAIFAYGSNMCRGRLLDYKVNPEGPGQPAELRGYALRLNKVGRKGGRRSGKGNVEHCPGETVWGVLYTIPDHELTILDEGEGPGYRRVRLRVESSAEPVDAWVHVAKKPSNDPELRPYGWYKRFIVEGARSHGLPAEYIAKLEAIEAIDDPDREWERNRRGLTCD